MALHARLFKYNATKEQHCVKAIRLKKEQKELPVCKNNPKESAGVVCRVLQAMNNVQYSKNKRVMYSCINGNEIMIEMTKNVALKKVFF